MQWKYRISSEIRKFIKKPISTENSKELLEVLTKNLKPFLKKDVDQIDLEELLEHLDFDKDCLTMTDEELAEFELEKLQIPSLIDDHLKEFWNFCDENRIFVELDWRD
jgi:hypothetical protein